MSTNLIIQDLIPLAVDENGSAVLIGTVTPAQAGDALTLNYDPTTMYGTLSLSGTSVFYTPAAGGSPVTDQISYTVSEAGVGASPVQSGSFLVEPAPAVTAVTLAAPVEVGQSVVIGTVAATLPNDPLTLANTSGAGTLALGAVANGVQDVLYTAPASTGGAAADSVSYTVVDQYGLSSAAQVVSVALDPGLAYLASAPSVLVSGQSAVIAVLTPGLAGDALTLTAMNKAAAAGLSIGPVLADGTEQLIYTAPASVTTSGSRTLSYTIEDQHVGGHSYAAQVQLDAGPVVTPATPTGNLENRQAMVIGSVAAAAAGDTLTLTQGPGLLGVVSLGAADANGVQQVIYTAPAHIHLDSVENVAYSITDQHGSPAVTGAATVQLDFGVIVASTGPHILSAGQSAVVDTITAGLPGDVVTFTKQTGSLGHFTLVKNGVNASGANLYNVVYTETGAFSTFQRDYATFQVQDRAGGKLAGDGPVIRLDPRPPAITTQPATTVEKGQSLVLGIVTPGTAGDAFALTQTGAIAGTLALAVVGGVTEVVYTAPSAIARSGADLVNYTVTDQNGGSATSASTYVRLDNGPTSSALPPSAVVAGQSTIIGTAYAGLAADTLSLTQTGASNGTVTLSGNKIIYTAAANVASTSADTVSYVVSDQHNDATVSGASSVKVLGATPINGNAPIVSTTSGSFYDVASGSPAMTFTRFNSAVLLEGGRAPPPSPTAATASRSMSGRAACRPPSPTSPQTHGA